MTWSSGVTSARVQSLESSQGDWPTKCANFLASSGER